MNKEKKELKRLAEDMILTDEQITDSDKLLLIDEELNDDILIGDCGFVDNLKNEGCDIDLCEPNDVGVDDPGIVGW